MSETTAVKLGGSANSGIWGMDGVQLVKHQSDFKELAENLNVEEGWHEPSRQELTLDFKGKVFNNAGYWGHKVAIAPDSLEQYVTLKKDGKPIAEVNIVDLMSWASQIPKAHVTKKPNPKAIHERFQTPEFTEFCFELMAGDQIELIDFKYLAPRTIAISSTVDNHTVPRSWALGILAKDLTTITVTNEEGVHTFDCMTYPQAWDELIELIRIGAINYVRHTGLIGLFSVLKEQMSGMDASDIFHEAFENYHGDYNLHDMMESLQQDPIQVLSDYISNLRAIDVDEEEFISTAEDYLNIDVDVIMEHAGCDHRAKGVDWLKIAEDMEVEVPDNIANLIEKKDLGPRKA